jgi:hypothetical protein
LWMSLSLLLWDSSGRRSDMGSTKQIFLLLSHLCFFVKKATTVNTAWGSQDDPRITIAGFANLFLFQRAPVLSIPNPNSPGFPLSASHFQVTRSHWLYVGHANKLVTLEHL